MKYRSDIDGLRALAVIIVILFHAGIGDFNSGFIGVDIFFVISGYLICNIMLSGSKEPSFSLANFYSRRLWRLQPSLLMMMVFSSVIATIFYLPDDYNTFLHSARNTLYFMSNSYFSGATTAYASPDAKSLLLLHTWSLSIEWQWYLAFPVVFYFLYRVLTPRKLAIVNHVVTLILLVTTLYLSLHSDPKNYYRFIARAFELQLGSCIAFYHIPRINRLLATSMGIGSLIVLVMLSLTPDILSGYPNIYTVLVVILTGLLIISGTDAKNISARILSSRAVVYIGKRSYSLYLWHWPILAVISYAGLSDDKTVISFGLLATLAAALLSYRYIESPLRKCKMSLVKSVMILLLAPLSLFASLYSVSGKFNDFPGRFGQQYQNENRLINQYAKEAGHRSDCLTDGVDSDNKDDLCTFGKRPSQKKAFFIGDSNSNHYWLFLDVLAKNADMAITAQSTASCLTLPGIYQFDWWHFHNDVYNVCHDNTAIYYNKIKMGHYDYVIVGELWPMYNSDKIINQPDDTRSIELAQQRLRTAMKNALNIIEQSGAIPVIMKEIYTRPQGYEVCIKNKLIKREHYSNGECNTTDWDAEQKGWFDTAFEDLKKEYPNLIVIDIKDVQCSGNRCRTEVNGVSIFRDVGHLNDYAAHYFGEEYLKVKGNPFIQN
ncbi:acyltransferase family protein [Serratia marcescens]|uniref:acyltransferase family protein n=1 Tax=Serratia marcescens TaxID=615 RepID=UPI0007456840|nr:acyltransferase family protein [Serratia marcescens]CVH45974.1 O-acetyltransferase OatA [Serratia marcescens]